MDSELDIADACRACDAIFTEAGNQPEKAIPGESIDVHVFSVQDLTGFSIECYRGFE